MNKISILLIENDDRVRQQLASYFQLKGHRVSAIKQGRDFYITFGNGHYDIAVIDMEVSDQRGIVLVEYVRKNSSMKIVVMSRSDSQQERISCYQAGADLFMKKPVDPKELLAAMSSMSDRTLTDCQDKRIGWSYQPVQRTLKPNDETVIRLTGSEQKIMDLLAASHGEVVSRDQLLEAVYGHCDISVERALDTMIRRLRQKIQRVTHETAPILTAYGRGFSFAEEVRVEQPAQVIDSLVS